MDELCKIKFLLAETMKIETLNISIAMENQFFYSIAVEEMITVDIELCIKTHGSVLCSPRKWGARKLREYITGFGN